MPDPIDRILELRISPVVRLTSAGTIKGWNSAAADRFPWLKKRARLLAVAPRGEELAGALASKEDDVAIPSWDARLIRISPRERLLIVEVAQYMRRMEEAIFASTHDAIFFIDPDDEIILEANPAARELYGREMKGVAISSLSTNFKPGLTRRIVAEGFVHFETTHRTARSPETHLDVHGTTVSYGGRTVVLGIMRDLTTEIAQRRELLTSEEKYRRLVSNVPAIIWTTGEDLVPVFISPNVEQITGFSAHEILTADAWKTGVHPDDRAHVFDAYQRHFASDAPLEMEYRFLRKDGTWAWFREQARHAFVSEGRKLTAGVTQDITERKRGELQQLALAEFGRRVLSGVDEQTLMDEACRLVAEVLETTAAAVLIFEEQANAFRTASAYGYTAPDFLVPNEPSRLASQAFTAAGPISYGDLRHETRFEIPMLLDLGVRAGIAAPIVGSTTRFGVIHPFTREPREFSPRELAFVQSIAHVLAEAMQRGRTDRELERRQAQLADAQALANIGSFEIDLIDGAIDWSEEMYRIAGLEPRSRPITLEFLLSLLPAEIHDILQAVAVSEPRGAIIDNEHLMYRVAGEPRMVHSRARVIVDRVTGNTKLVGTVQDITERVAAAAALRDRERRLELIVSSLPVMLWSTDAELRVNSMNGSGFATGSSSLNDLEVTTEDIVGPAPAAPADGPEAALLGRSVTFDTKVDERDLRVHVEPMRDEMDAIAGTVGVAFDITEERRAAEVNRALLEQVHHAAEEWRVTFDSIEAPLVIVDAQTRVRRMNIAALRLSRFDDYHEALDQPVASLGPAGIWADIDAIARAVASKQHSIAVQVADRDGRSWDLLASPSASHQTIVIASDVTELVRMKDRLVRTERVSEMGSLVAGVAHEVRNPLFGISATLDAFEFKYGSEEFSGYITALREQVDRMSELMHELLEFGRPIASLRPPVTIKDVIDTAIANAGALARKRNVALRAIVPDEQILVAMDRPRMLQLFDNLIANAIQHSTDGTRVDISACVSEDGSEVNVAVEDRGKGFEEDDLTRIFEPFFTRRRGGTGLGLSIAQRIAEEHKGVIVPANREGGGASMTVTLPVMTAEAD